MNNKQSEDALDQDTTSLELGLGYQCPVCNKQTDHDGSVYECYEIDCPCDVKAYYPLEGVKELDFNEE